MNIHTQLGPQACHLINIQEPLIDYHVFADMRCFVMSSGWINVSCTVYISAASFILSFLSSASTLNKPLHYGD